VNSGCIAAYDRSYTCWGETDAFRALKKMSNEPVDCSEFTKEMEEAPYWIKKVDAKGDTTVSLSAVGENGWLVCGTRFWSDKHGDSFSDECACWLDSITTDSVLVGGCMRYNLVMMSTTQGSYKICTENKCDFAIPTLKNAVDKMTKPSCINYFHKDTVILDSIATNSSAYQVFVSDDEISVKILETTVTWTKRPGL